MKKIRTAPKGSPKKSQVSNYTNPQARMLSPRQRLVMDALLDGPHSRREIDLLTGGYNGPAVIHQLRGLGIAIECHTVLYTNNLGRWERRGIYRLARTGKRRQRGGR